MNFWHDAWIARYALLRGLAVTAEVSLSVIAIGSLIGIFGGISLQYGPRPIRLLARAYVDTLRGVPLLVLILASFYGVALANVQLSALSAGIIALSLFCGAHVSETVRGALGSIPVAQAEAAKAIGLRFGQMLRHVILPQAVRRILPAWVNTAVEIVKASALLSIIGVVELLLATQQVIGRTYEVIPFYLTACIIYFTLNVIISQAGAMLERRFGYLQY
jgi:polar amino acid transport system permease protein